jgi:hypothetical protein
MRRKEKVDNDTTCAQPLDLKILGIHVGGGGDICENDLLQVLMIAYLAEIQVERQGKRHRILPGRRRGFE